MPLRPSQVETLRAVEAGTDRSMTLAHAQGIKRVGAERKLRALVASGHLTREISGLVGPYYRLTQLGREALEGDRG
jgi:DNA-binding HxlR family transcriptional regulator